MFKFSNLKSKNDKPKSTYESKIKPLKDITDNDDAETICWAGDCYRYGIETSKSLYTAGYKYYIAWKKGSNLGELKLNELRGLEELKNEFNSYTRRYINYI